MPDQPNIILLVVDTLAARHMSCYGYERATTPNIDRIASQGMRFARMTAPNIPTTPAYTSMFTGMNAFTHGAISLKNKASGLDPSIQTLPMAFASGGYMTGAVSNLIALRRWFCKGFHFAMLPDGGRNAAHMVARAIAWLEKIARQPFFLFLHCWDPHTPYMPPEDLKRRYYDGDEKDPENRSLDHHRSQVVYPFYEKFHLDKYGAVTDADYITALYDAEITSADRELARLFAFLEESVLAQNTVLFLTGDHGENMTEHGFYWCHQGTYEEVISVPLIMWGPGRVPAGKVSDALVQHADLMPTFTQLAGIETEQHSDGMGLAPLLDGKSNKGHEFVVLSECVWQARCGIRTTEWKFMKTIDKGLFDLPPRELYNLERDPTEMNNVVEKHPELARELEYRMDRWIEERLGNRPNPLRVESAAGLDGFDMLERAVARRGVTWDSLTPGSKGETK